MQCEECNRPFSSCFYLFQDNSWWTTLHIEMRVSCTFILLQIKLRTRFKTEEKNNSEMICCWKAMALLQQMVTWCDVLHTGWQRRRQALSRSQAWLLFSCVKHVACHPVWRILYLVTFYWTRLIWTIWRQEQNYSPPFLRSEDDDTPREGKEFRDYYYVTTDSTTIQSLTCWGFIYLPFSDAEQTFMKHTLFSPMA